MNPQIFWKCLQKVSISAIVFENKGACTCSAVTSFIYLLYALALYSFFLFLLFIFSRKAGPRQRSIHRGSFRAGRSGIFQCSSTARAATTRCLKFYLSLQICTVPYRIYCTQIIFNRRGPEGFSFLFFFFVAAGQTQRHRSCERA